MRRAQERPSIGTLDWIKMIEITKLLQRRIRWQAIPEKEPFFAPVGNDPELTGYELRINPAYPEDPLFTLIHDGSELGDLEELPASWEHGPIPWKKPGSNKGR